MPNSLGEDVVEYGCREEGFMRAMIFASVPMRLRGPGRAA